MNPNDEGEFIITLVHGTWGRGIFPPKRDASSGRWFDADSSFCIKLKESLQSEGIPYSIEPFIWSGSNSIHARDKAAQHLAQQIARKELEHPLANQVIIAHSHGGNIALRMQEYLGENLRP